MAGQLINAGVSTGRVDSLNAVAIAMAGVTVQGTGFFISFMICAAFLYRLMTQKLPRDTQRPGVVSPFPGTNPPSMLSGGNSADRRFSSSYLLDLAGSPLREYVRKRPFSRPRSLSPFTFPLLSPPPTPTWIDMSHPTQSTSGTRPRYTSPTTSWAPPTPPRSSGSPPS